MNKKKRRKEFVDKAVQGALVRRLLIHWFAFIVISLALGITLQALTHPFRPLAEHFGAFVQTNICFLIAIACMTPVFLFDAVRLSNRFAGPVYRLRLAMAELNKGGRPKPLKFRPNDFWKEMAQEFNQVADGYFRRSEDASAQESPTNENAEPEHVINA